MLIFGLSLLLVYLVLAGQYESWITPISVLLAVPLALLGTVAALSALGLANNIYTQIGLVLLDRVGRQKRYLGGGSRAGRTRACTAKPSSKPQSWPRKPASGQS